VDHRDRGHEHFSKHLLGGARLQLVQRDIGRLACPGHAVARVMGECSECSEGVFARYRAAAVFAALASPTLAISWLLVSTLAENNDRFVRGSPPPPRSSKQRLKPAKPRRAL
jgi:hypothetical protein